MSATGPQSLYHWYITEAGKVLGIHARDNPFVVVDSGPPVAWNPAKRLLTTQKGMVYLLPEGAQERSSFLWPTTREWLRRLAAA